MKWIDKFKASRRRAQVARLRREIADLESLIPRLNPDYDCERIANAMLTLTDLRYELHTLTGRTSPNVQP